MQTDATVGAITDALEKNGFADNTLVIFTSDNGCSKAAGIPKLREQGHYVSAQYRGSKADSWDGGHRVPFLVRWPGKVEAGSSCDQLITLVDVFATVSDITGEKAPNMAEDSVSFLPALSGEPVRGSVIHHKPSGQFAIRHEDWLFVDCKSGGVREPGWFRKERRVLLHTSSAELFNLKADPQQTSNLYDKHPEKARELKQLLEQFKKAGRSRK